MAGNSKDVTLVFVGDIHFEDSNVCISEDIKKIFESADYVVANLETPTTKRCGVLKNKILLRQLPETPSILRKEWGVDAISLANNHIFDCGEAGFEDTRQEIKSTGLECFGAGRNLEEAARPLIIEKKGRKIAVIGCSWEDTESQIATVDSYGCFPVEKGSLIASISQFVKKYAAVIVYPHWGFCRYINPPPENSQLARDLIEAGATAVIGHHSHVVQGIECTGKSLIAHSLGDFAFMEYSLNGRLKPRDSEIKQGIILLLKIAPDNSLSFEVFHTQRVNGMIQLNPDDNRKKEFEERCRIVSSSDYAKHWRRSVRNRLIARALFWSNPVNWSQIGKRQFSGLKLMLIKMRKGSSR